MLLLSHFLYKQAQNKRQFGETTTAVTAGSIVGTLIVLLAVYVSLKCHPSMEGMGTTIGYAILALIFSEIYLIQFAVRKYILKSANYCTGPWAGRTGYNKTRAVPMM